MNGPGDHKEPMAWRRHQVRNRLVLEFYLSSRDKILKVVLVIPGITHNMVLFISKLRRTSSVFSFFKMHVVSTTNWHRWLFLMSLAPPRSEPEYYIIIFQYINIFTVCKAHSCTVIIPGPKQLQPQQPLPVGVLMLPLITTLFSFVCLDVKINIFLAQEVLESLEAQGHTVSLVDKFGSVVVGIGQIPLPYFADIRS